MLMNAMFVMIGMKYRKSCWYVLRSLRSSLESNQHRQSSECPASEWRWTDVLSPDSVDALTPK